MVELQAVAVKKKKSLIKRVGSQTDTAFAGLTAFVWLAEQSLPELFGSWWPKMPFLEAAVIFGVFSLGRNFSAIWASLKAKGNAFTITAVKADKLHTREVLLEIEFHKNFKNAKVILDLYEIHCVLGGPCQYMKRATVKKGASGDINKSDKITTPLVKYSSTGEHDEGNPLFLNRGQKNAMEFQLKAVVSVTSSNKKIVRREIDIFLPAGTNTAFMISTMGKECREQILTETKTHDYKELIT